MRSQTQPKIVNAVSSVCVRIKRVLAFSDILLCSTPVYVGTSRVSQGHPPQTDRLESLNPFLFRPSHDAADRLARETSSSPSLRAKSPWQPPAQPSWPPARPPPTAASPRRGRRPEPGTPPTSELEWRFYWKLVRRSSVNNAKARRLNSITVLSPQVAAATVNGTQ